MIKGIVPQLAQTGAIKIGRKGEVRTSKSGKQFQAPQKLDHFLVTSNRRGEDGNLVVDVETMAALEKQSDGHVREIPIVLHSDKIDEVFPTAYACYASHRCLCRGDGEKARRAIAGADGKPTGKFEDRACPCDYLGAQPPSPVCKPNGILHCSIALPGRAVAGAVHKWRTTSLISVQRMIGSLQQILQVAGVLRGIPLVLRIEPIDVAPAGAPASTVYCCHVELRATDLQQVQRQAMEAAEIRRALGTGDVEGYRALLTAPAAETEPPEEQRAVAEEFYAETPPDLGAILAGIECAETQEELAGIAESAKQLPASDIDAARQAYAKRKAQLNGNGGRTRKLAEKVKASGRTSIVDEPPPHTDSENTAEAKAEP